MAECRAFFNQLKDNIMRVRFGMLMTDAVGKAGGQCIQRRAGVRVLRNISVPTQRTASTQNPQRFLNNYLFTQFSKLSQSIRDQWATIGSTLKGVNTWGEEKNYNGREAFLLTNCVLYPYEHALINPFTFSFDKPALTIDDMSLTRTGSKFIIETEIDQDGYYYQCKMLLLRSAALNPDVSKLKTVFRLDDISDANALYAYVHTAFPNIAVNDIMSVAIRSVNRSGLVSPWTQRQLKVS